MKDHSERPRVSEGQILELASVMLRNMSRRMDPEAVQILIRDPLEVRRRMEEAFRTRLFAEPEKFEITVDYARRDQWARPLRPLGTDHVWEDTGSEETGIHRFEVTLLFDTTSCDMSNTCQYDDELKWRGLMRAELGHLVSLVDQHKERLPRLNFLATGARVLLSRTGMPTHNLVYDQKFGYGVKDVNWYFRADEYRVVAVRPIKPATTA